MCIQECLPAYFGGLVQPEKTWIDILTALLTPMLAVFAALIAYLQWRTNELKRKNDYFDRRYNFYKRIESMWLSSSTDEQLSIFGFETEDLIPMAEEADLLFGKDVAKHIISLSGKHHDGSPFFTNDDFSKPFRKYLRLK